MEETTQYSTLPEQSSSLLQRPQKYNQVQSSSVGIPETFLEVQQLPRWNETIYLFTTKCQTLHQVHLPSQFSSYNYIVSMCYHYDKSLTLRGLHYLLRPSQKDKSQSQNSNLDLSILKPMLFPFTMLPLPRNLQNRSCEYSKKLISHCKRYSL